MGGAIKKFQSPKPLGQEIMKEYMYTLKEIIDAWENNYGGDMEKDYPRFFKELKKLQAPSPKPQAPSLTVDEGFSRMDTERKIMEVKQLKRIADAIEEILRLVKKDMEPREKSKK